MRSPWFTPMTAGQGFVPASAKGWIAVAIFVLALVLLACVSLVWMSGSVAFGWRLAVFIAGSLGLTGGFVLGAARLSASPKDRE
ncbi:hypothetical protein [Celeribacter sp. SCSIO 80788]|jgi:hypothetical protein|uniref:hypothetical protein n=1 Tax=Celeribacter sp. SCSIO 80788 TaxID=3117013 RepID=UPI003DA6033A